MTVLWCLAYLVGGIACATFDVTVIRRWTGGKISEANTAAIVAVWPVWLIVLLAYAAAAVVAAVFVGLAQIPLFFGRLAERKANHG